ncbi:LytR/AlgR family response regulator transcription factor [Parapedobacter deserti]|uniref:LytR/AlgR family response regulator transcription factor n=1 Tax=Parapedobacter deserti TaxID=1912957 RepID=A0ABV7JJF7_9SPHI
MHVLIVEDEPLAAANLEKILGEVAPDIRQISRTESVAQTATWFPLHGREVNLIFMDIHLSDGSAFSIFQATEIDVPVIFTTAYDQYALQAFKVNSIDYLLKPIDKTHLEQAMHKFRKQGTAEVARYLSRLAVMAPFGRFPEKILVPVHDKLVPVAVEEISYCYSTNGETSIVTKDGKSLSYNKRLDSIMLSLDPDRFFRANKQFIIAKRAIEGITIWFDNRLMVSLNTRVPESLFVSKNRASEFRQWVAG